ncbi:hypothetical protein FJQ98_16170 [Lysinibacillus agricola]|uniref:Uncharacterized protein n=1 Tax=Lysinibacillus agricola TaxID=2590012 RepID=A0ABX7ALK6_9BACI|nr:MULTISPECIES: hypothetical protein [Lysinibacillus]QQP10782.1 hypothetical protein FJQ98_16170 [Lysinibacillus agricola]
MKKEIDEHYLTIIEKERARTCELIDLIKRLRENCEIPYNGLRKEVRMVIKKFDNELNI